MPSPARRSGRYPGGYFMAVIVVPAALSALVVLLRHLDVAR